MRVLLISLLSLGLLPAVAVGQETPAGSPPPAGAAPTTDVIVRFKPGVDAGERGTSRSHADVRRADVLPLSGTELVAPEPGVRVATAVRALQRDPDVLYAEPNRPRAAFATPDDALFGYQWGLASTGQSVGGSGGTPGSDIDAPAAWDVTTGSREVVVGVVDSGVDTAHPDLRPNLWQNPGEAGAGRATNGLDDDGNGFVDDVNGWDFAEHDARPEDANGHGTHVTGTIGAKGNDGAGVAGVSWASELMALRALDANGSGTVADVVSAYAYAAANGARVVNVSLGGDTGSLAERDALAHASGVLFVVAAGNASVNNDVSGSFPCNYELPNVICVGATDRNDARAPFSNYGARTVDLGAPGVTIASTWLGGGHALMSGTSMATPHVTGVAALALARAPQLTVAQLRQVLLSSVDPVPALRGVTVTGGRVNAARAVAAAADAAATALGQPASGAGSSSGAVNGSPPVLLAPVPPAGGLVDPGADQGALPVADSDPAADPFDPADGAPAPKPADDGSGSDDPDPDGAEAPTPSAMHRAPRPAADRIAPGLVLSAARAVRAPTLRARGLRATVGCSETCRLSITLTLDAAAARRAGLRGRVIATLSTTLARAGDRAVVVRVSAAARARLRGSGRVSLRATAMDAEGNRRVRTVTVLVRR